MTAREKAESIHRQGYNCAQSVLGSCREYSGMDEGTALSVAAGFGGGMKCGEVCGAVSGGVMAIGSAVMGADPSDRQLNAKSAELCREYIDTVRQRYGVITCRELKSPEHMVPCDKIIAECAELVDEILKNNIKGDK